MSRDSVEKLRQRLEGLEDAEAKARTRLGAIRTRTPPERVAAGKTTLRGRTG